MDIKYVIKDMITQLYDCGGLIGYNSNIILAEMFDDISDAENIILGCTGYYAIEKIYIAK